MLADARGETVSWRNGTKGRLKACFAAVRVRTADGPPQRIWDKGQQHLPGDEAWLVGEHRESGQRGWKLYSFHAPEVECIGKGKAAAPYEFGVKASIVTNNRRAPGGLFVLHARAMPDNPYDGHTLRDVIDRTETLTGCPIERAYVDKGYRGHDAQNPRRVFISGQKRGVFGVIKRELRRRSAIEPIIGHLKSEGHLGRCYLKGRAGDAANVVLSAAGHNFRRILALLRALWSLILSATIAATNHSQRLKSAS
jgi:IS5 family transposase